MRAPSALLTEPQKSGHAWLQGHGPHSDQVGQRHHQMGSAMGSGGSWASTATQRLAVSQAAGTGTGLQPVPPGPQLGRQRPFCRPRASGQPQGSHGVPRTLRASYGRPQPRDSAQTPGTQEDPLSQDVPGAGARTGALTLHAASAVPTPCRALSWLPHDDRGPLAGGGRASTSHTPRGCHSRAVTAPRRPWHWEVWWGCRLPRALWVQGHRDWKGRRACQCSHTHLSKWESGPERMWPGPQD